MIEDPFPGAGPWSRASFERRHALLARILSEVAVHVRSAPRTQKGLQELRLVLETHWARQPEALWVSLARRGGEGDAGAAEFLRVDLRDLKIRHLEFFERHLDNATPVSLRRLPADFRRFSEAVTARIRMEQDYLFPRLPDSVSGDRTEESPSF